MANPYRPFGLTEITRRLNLNKATCHAILMTMAQYGFLVQHPRNKSYRLGPSIVAAANSALARFPLLEYARPVFEKLSSEIGCGMAVTAIANRQQVLLAYYGNTSGISEAFQLGLRLPNTAPIAACFAAFAPTNEMEAWLTRAHSGPGGYSEALDKSLRIALINIRSRGYEVTLRTEAEKVLIQRLSEPYEHWGLNQQEEHSQQYQQDLCREPYLLDKIQSDKSYPVNTLTVPIFLYDDTPAMCLVAGSLKQSLTGADIERIAQGMRASAEQVKSTALRRTQKHLPP